MTIIVGDEYIDIDNHAGFKKCYQSKYLFVLSGQVVSFDPVNYDIFFGMNRVIIGNYRSGKGLCRAVITAVDCL